MESYTTNNELSYEMLRSINLVCVCARLFFTNQVTYDKNQYQIYHAWEILCYVYTLIACIIFSGLRMFNPSNIPSPSGTSTQGITSIIVYHYLLLHSLLLSKQSISV